MANLYSFDLNLLRVLDALLRDHSTVRAGERLGLSQPAVSAALRRLRESLGDDLFFRQGQGLAATQFALSLQAPLRDLMERIELLIEGPAPFDPSTSQATFKLSGSDFFAELLMPKLAERLQLLAPYVRVHLVDLVPDRHIETLEQYDIDLALVPASGFPDWVDSQLVFRSSFSVVARQRHPRLGRAGARPGEIIPLDLFCDLGHVVFSPEGNQRAMGDAALAKVGRERNVVMTLPTFAGVYRAVAGSDMIALLPSALADHIAPSAGLDVYRAPIPVPTADLHMVWHRRNTSSSARAWLRTQIADLLAPLDEGRSASASDWTN